MRRLLSPASQASYFDLLCRGLVGFQWVGF